MATAVLSHTTFETSVANFDQPTTVLSHTTIETSVIGFDQSTTVLSHTNVETSVPSFDQQTMVMSGVKVLEQENNSLLGVTLEESSEEEMVTIRSSRADLVRASIRNATGVAYLAARKGDKGVR